jgi:hypothetical protein
MFAKYRSAALRGAGVLALTAAVLAPLAIPTPAHAWWRPGFGVYIAPPVVVAPYPPAVVYAPPPAYYPAPVYVAPGYYGAYYGGYYARGYYGHGYYR